METIVALLITVADVYAIVKTLQSRAPNVHKLLWCLLVVILPVVGFIVWYLAGPKGRGA